MATNAGRTHARPEPMVPDRADSPVLMPRLRAPIAGHLPYDGFLRRKAAPTRPEPIREAFGPRSCSACRARAPGADPDLCRQNLVGDRTRPRARSRILTRDRSERCLALPDRAPHEGRARSGVRGRSGRPDRHRLRPGQGLFGPHAEARACRGPRVSKPVRAEARACRSPRVSTPGRRREGRFFDESPAGAGKGRAPPVAPAPPIRPRVAGLRRRHGAARPMARLAGGSIHPPGPAALKAV